MRPQRFTDSDPTRSVVLWKDPDTFSGWDEKNNLVIKDEETLRIVEFPIAERELAGKPAGTKLYPYDYQPTDHIDQDGKKIRLTYSFIVIEIKKEKTVCAIDHGNNDVLIYEASSLGRTIPEEHWRFAKDHLMTQKIYTKLPSHQKVYNALGIKHAFMVVSKNVNGKLEPGETMIVAKATHGWKIGEGSFSTHQVALCKREDGRLGFLDIKTLRKYKYTSYDSAFIQSEIDISVANNLFLGIAKTQDKNRFFMTLYQTDFFAHLVSCEKKLKAITDKKEILKRYNVVFAEILLRAALQLEKLHAKNVLHRDIKPENILLMLNDHLVGITDFGLSVLLEPGQDSYQGRCVGTLTYMAPEIQPNARDASGRVIYTRQSDIFAFAKIFKIISDNFYKNNFLQDIFVSMGVDGTQENPKMRPHLVYFQLTLICFLGQAVSQQAGFSAFSEKYRFPIKTMLFAETLLLFFNRSKTNTHHPFFDNTWVKVFAQLEHTYDCAKESTQRNIRCTLLDWRIATVPLPEENLIFTLQKKEPYDVFFDVIKQYFESENQAQKERILREAIAQKQEVASDMPSSQDPRFFAAAAQPATAEKGEAIASQIAAR